MVTRRASADAAADAAAGAELRLRDYQLDLMARVRQSLKQHKRVICQAPTGSGKTALAVYMMGRAKERGLRSMFCVHRRELVDQTGRALWDQHLEHGLIQSGRMRSQLPIQVASVQTLRRRLDWYAEPDLIVIDEAHRAAADTYRRILEAYPNARVVGLTATPERTDGKGLDDLFGDIQCGPPMRWLIDNGYLSDYRIFAPGQQVDMSGVHTRGGEYVRDELEDLMDKPTITGDAVQHYKRYAAGKSAIVFCVSRKHAAHVADSFRENGITAEAVDGTTPDGERGAALKRFSAGHTKVLCGVELFVEGLDVPGVEAVIMLRPTQSLIVHLQAIGRALRPHPGKETALILDHVGNSMRHGLPDDEREWSLRGKQEREKKSKSEEEVTVKQCPICFAIHRPAPQCPYCGHSYGPGGREIQQQDGELVELDQEAMRRERKREQGKARAIEALAELGVRRGMKKPAAWAAFCYAAREGRKPSPDEFKSANDAVREYKRREAV